jgi:hypothetical protein
MKTYKEIIDEMLEEAEKVIHSARRGPMGLTLEEDKTPQWKEAKRQFAYWFKELQKYNKQFLKTHKHTGYMNVNGKRVATYQPK